MPIEINKMYRGLIDKVERLISDFSTSQGAVEIEKLSKEEAEETRRILKESERGSFYEYRITAVINPVTTLESYKLIVKRK